jgi:hypothetical protein
MFVEVTGRDYDKDALEFSLRSRPFGSSAAAMDLSNDPAVMRADPHPTTAVAARLVADRTGPISPPSLHPEDQPSGEDHRAEYEHGIRGVHHGRLGRRRSQVQG